MTVTSRPIIVSSIVPSGFPCSAAKILLGLVIDTFIATNQPLVIAVDDTLEQELRPAGGAPGHLPRRRALQAWASGDHHGHPVALLQRHRPASLEQSALGLAVPHHPGAITRREHEAAQGPSNRSETRHPARATPSSLATGPPSGAHGGLELRGRGTGARVSPGKGDLDRPDAHDSGAVCTSPAPADGKTWGQAQ